jgi:DNA-binding MarR family transcriptional regulator
MDQTDKLDKIKFIFGSLFILANKLQVLGDNFLDEITTKQWFLLVMVGQFKDHYPTLSQVASLMGSSHQNAKQIALKLEKKGLICIEKDTKDSRAIRLKLTPACYEYFEGRQGKDNEFLEELFKDLNEMEINTLAVGIHKITERTGKIDPTLTTEKQGWITNMFHNKGEELK